MRSASPWVRLSSDGANLLGATVNIAARLEAIAPAGGLCISGAVHNAIAREQGQDWQDLGFRHLKNLVEPVRVYRFAGGGAGPLPVVAEARKALTIVFPFTNPGGLAEESYLSEGITEDVIAGLSRFGRLAVLGMTSSDVYRNHSPDLPKLVRSSGSTTP